MPAAPGKPDGTVTASGFGKQAAPQRPGGCARSAPIAMSGSGGMRSRASGGPGGREVQTRPSVEAEVRGRAVRRRERGGRAPTNPGTLGGGRRCARRPGWKGSGNCGV